MQSKYSEAIDTRSLINGNFECLRAVYGGQWKTISSLLTIDQHAV